MAEGLRELAGHTPGPWEFRPSEKVSYYHRNVFAAGKPVAHVLSTKNWSAIGNADANARLIALCPEMFEYIESGAKSGCATAAALIVRAHIQENHRG